MMLPAMLLPLLSAGALIGLAMLIRQSGMPEDRFISAAFLIFGVALGLASAILWPGDLGVYVNVLGTAAGDFIYRISIQAIGNPNSAQAHFTIPWILRIPQVYAWVTPALYGAIGLLINILYSHIRKREAGIRRGKTG